MKSIEEIMGESKIDSLSSRIKSKDVVDERKIDIAEGQGDEENEKALKKLERKRRRVERKELSNDVPHVDANGVSYTKKQIRFMKKRVSRGLAPLESEEEKKERLKQEAITKEEEEKELAALMFDETDEKVSTDYGRKQKNETVDDDSDSSTNEGPENGDSDSERKELDTTDQSSKDHLNKHSTKKEDRIVSQSDVPICPSASSKKTMRQKPVPNDYVCSACQNNHQPKHWIYDCPFKQTIRGVGNQLSKGLKDPDERKVFVSGLPFDFKMKDVTELFAKTIKDSKVLHCKVIKYADTGRCKGQAYVTFDTNDGASQAIAMSGMKIDKSESNQQQQNASSRSSQLVLKVSKCLNRFEAKNKKTHHVGRKRKQYDDETPE